MGTKKKKLIVLSGETASGKSQWAEKYRHEHPNERVIITSALGQADKVLRDETFNGVVIFDPDVPFTVETVHMEARVIITANGQEVDL